MSDLIKAPVIFLAYFLLAPLLGWFVKDSRKAQRALFGLMVFMTSWHINKFTLMLDSVELYRGHTKGFEFSLIEVLALALITASFLTRRQAGPGWRWLPPGALLYLLYCAVSCVSIFAAPEKIYTVMAAVRFTKAVLIFVGAFHFIREEEDVRFLLKAVAFSLGVQLLVVLQMKYIGHFYQIHGWFEHQNPLAMWAYMGGLPLLAAAMSDAPKRDTRWYFAGFIACAIIIQCSLSRASLVFFAAGVVLVVGLAFADGVTMRRVVSVLSLGAVGALGLLLSLSTITARFHDEGNEASGETRDVMNQAAKAMLHASPIGIGWNNFALTINSPFSYGDVIDEWERDRGHKVDPDYAKGVVESHYWLLLAETGYAGFGAYLLFIIFTGVNCLRGAAHWRGSFLAAFLGGLAVALALTYVHSTLERVLTQTKNLSLWLILLGVAGKLEIWRRQEANKLR